MIADPVLLLLDEPTSGVDIRTRDEVLHLLADLNAQGVTIVLTTHELNSVAAHLPWVVCVNRRIVAEGDPDEVFTAAILNATYAADLRVVRQDGNVLVADAAPHRLRDALRHRHDGYEHAHHEHDGAPHEHLPRRARLMELLTEPFGYAFFRQGLAVSVLVGLLCGLIGVYVVLRHMSYIGHGLSHAVFGGAVVAYVASVDFYLGAGLWGFAAALLINAVARRRRIGADAAIGIVTTASFALGVALISKTRSFTTQLRGGAVRQHPGRDAGRPAGGRRSSPSAVAVFIALFYKRLLFMTFDPEVAPIFGIRTGRVDTPVRAGAGGDDRGVHQRRGRHAHRGDAHHPGHDGAPADRLLRAGCSCLSAFLGAAAGRPGHVRRATGWTSRRAPPSCCSRRPVLRRVRVAAGARPPLRVGGGTGVTYHGRPQVR